MSDLDLYPSEGILENTIPHYSEKWYKSFEYTVCRSLYKIYKIRPTTLKKVRVKLLSEECAQLTIIFQHFGITYGLEGVELLIDTDELDLSSGDLRVAGDKREFKQPISIAS